MKFLSKLHFFNAINLVIFDLFELNCKNGTYMFNLQGFILNLCQLAQKVGHNEQIMLLRSPDLQPLFYFPLILLWSIIRALFYMHIFMIFM